MKEHHVIFSSYNNPLRTIYQVLIQPLIGDFFEVDVALRSQGTSSETRLSVDKDSELCSCCTVPWQHRNRDARPSKNVFKNSTSEAYSGYHLDVDKELFLWSVITGKREFNLLFWSRGKNKVCAALIAALVYRKRARKDHDNSYYQTADEFENLAVQILDRFYQINSRACVKAIIRQIPSYGNVTWLELAIKAEAKQFIAQRAVQDVLNNIWYGYIDHKESEMKIIFSTIMFWYSGFLRYHDKLVKTSDPTRFIDELLSKANLPQR
ncbi:unnamed protein product, partial [Rotaria sordida]